VSFGPRSEEEAELAQRLILILVRSAPVDNTLPTAVMYKPATGARLNGSVTFQVHASDAERSDRRAVELD